MASTKGKWAWHVHHDTPVETLIEPIRNRIKYIKDVKPPDEVPTRLRLLKVVKDQAAAETANQVWDNAVAPYRYDYTAKATKARNIAAREYGETLRKLHAKECAKDCPWKPDRKDKFQFGTIFPKKR